jgi:tRNA threonylcarbamoyladenosine biosynthesis protein TsaB
MALILGIETATSICSVALVKDGNIVAIRESVGTREHSAELTGYMSEVFAEAGFSYAQMDAVAVSMGPGSYTGLRIGVSSAKGLCYATGKPFIAIDTLKSLAWQALQALKAGNKPLENVLLCPMLDARRMEVYTAMYDQHLQVIENVNASIITEDAFNQFADREIVYFGDGASKCQSVLAGKSNLIFLDHINLTAKSVCMLAEEEFKAQNFADVAYCEPFYLKDFVAGKPRVKGLY